MNRCEVKEMPSKNGMNGCGTRRECSSDSRSEDSSSEEDDYDEDDDEDDKDFINSQVSGLFCDKIFPNILDLFKYEAEHNGFHLTDVLKRYNMDMISYIKMINFIRLHVRLIASYVFKSHIKTVRFLYLRSQRVKFLRSATKVIMRCHGTVMNS